MSKALGIAAFIAIICISLGGMVDALKRNTLLTQELAQAKYDLEQEKKQREALEKINIELTQQAAVRAEENAKYREQLAQDTDPALDGIVPTSVLRGLRSVRGANDSGRDSPASAH